MSWERVHGVSSTLFYLSPRIIVEQTPQKRGRERWITLGQLDSLLVVLVQFFLFSFFLFFFFSLCFCVFLCFHCFERKGRGCVVEDDKNISFSFHFKINSFFCFEKGGISLCLWGFLCPLCLGIQTWGYSDDLEDSSSENPLTESQLERSPPWSCRGFGCYDLAAVLFFGFCCCLYGVFFGGYRHQNYPAHVNFGYYCSSRRCCCDGIPIEDCLIGYFCCCCSVIQMTMAMDELFRMKSKVEGDLNIKRALWKRKKEVLTEEMRRWEWKNRASLDFNSANQAKFWLLFPFNYYYSFEII